MRRCAGTYRSSFEVVVLDSKCAPQLFNFDDAFGTEARVPVPPGSLIEQQLHHQFYSFSADDRPRRSLKLTHRGSRPRRPDTGVIDGAATLSTVNVLLADAALLRTLQLPGLET